VDSCFPLPITLASGLRIVNSLNLIFYFRASMKLNRLEAHDRLQHLKEDQAINIFRGAEECLKINELSLALQEKSPYIYIFAHPRTADDGVNKVMYWQPRLTIPEAQENSYLFRAISKSDLIEVVWMLPPREHWKQYKKGNITESNICVWSINRFMLDKSGLETPHPKDLPEEQARTILRAVIDEKRIDLQRDKIMRGLYEFK
jgi:hypothetical protein